ncbi:MAG: LptF/LptG family permease [Elusimicrobia bacterium]|nr:LptF/LptG family permease [Elusimicrobiota bacterium]
MITILPRYFLRSFLPSFLICLGIFSGVLLMNHFLKIFNMAVMRGISPIWIAACFTRLIPYVLSLAIPMAYLVALLLTLGQFTERGEVLALRASGFSFFDMTRAFLAVGMLLSGVLYYLNHKASPEGFHSFRNQYSLAAQQISRVELEPGAFTRLGPWKLYARSVEKGSGRLEGVYLVRLKASQSALRVEARRGRFKIEKGEGMTLELEDGRLQLPNLDPDKYTSGTFSRYRLEVPWSGGLLADRKPDIQELNSRRLKAMARDPATPPAERRLYAVERSLRSAAALSPFVFFWLAVPLGLRLTRHSRGLGFALSLVVLFSFYGLLAVGIGLGRRHAGFSAIGPWIADAAGLALGAFMAKRSLAQ